MEHRHHQEVARIVDDALLVANKEGVGPALEYMTVRGVERTVALRVLCGPGFHRPMPSRSE